MLFWACSKALNVETANQPLCTDRLVVERLCHTHLPHRWRPPQVAPTRLAGACAKSAVYIGCVTMGKHGSPKAHVLLMLVPQFSRVALTCRSVWCCVQGIEIKNPVLSLHPGDTSDSQEGDLLEIDLKLRLRAFPPLDMQF